MLKRTSYAMMDILGKEMRGEAKIRINM